VEEIEDLKVTIAGEITISSDPGKTMKKWREEFSVSQKDLAKHMGIGASIISDYETEEENLQDLNSSGDLLILL